ncbi:SAV_2336 N-terminal domain-related protein [Streptomyces beigongshangae]|uniref:SAV_2336 N-terminal domain-related protein n=1 Tax=Streptomyces beigongshangae TaxID=2841597 RepID=UPI001C85FB22|nr:SAV_2336 N-terminal domain-related protein [Streptomyces sp. REN17]
MTDPDPRLGAALRILKNVGQDLDPQEVLDVLWLARALSGDGSSGGGTADADGEAGGGELPLARTLASVHRLRESGAPGPDRANGATAREGDGPSGTPESGGPSPADPELHAGSLRDPLPDGPDADAPPEASRQDPFPPPPKEKSALPLRVPEDKALPLQLETGRALRRLKIKVASNRRQELDERATAAVLAETRLPDVVMRPARERWLHLVMVVDDGLSMLLWHRLATELRTAMQRLGAFRSLRVLGLDTRTSGGAPSLRGRPFDPHSSTMSPSVLTDPSGRTLVLVVSDGMGAAWRRGSMHGVLLEWAAAGPVAVVHALPPRLWAGSGIQADRWQATTRRPGGANTSWDVTDRVLPTVLVDFAGVPVPVLEPTPQALRDWARLITSPGTTVELPLLSRPREHEAVARSRAAGHLQHFRDAASPEAYRLAAHLAAVSPVSVPVMRLVQSAVPWQASTAHLAEVFLSGLVHPHPAPAPGPLPVQHRIFDFTEEAKSALLDAVPSAELLRTGRRIGRRLEQLAGRSPDFPAWLAHPDGADTLPSAFRSFTAVERRLMARFGVSMEPPRAALPTARPDRAARWSPLTPEDPRRLGGFHLHGRQVGNRTIVYLGRDSGDRQAAVRVVRPDQPASTHQLLVTEAEALRRMGGRYAPELLATGLDERPAWIATGLLTTAGGPDAPLPRLSDLIGPDAPYGSGYLDIITSLTLGWQLANALNISHLKGLAPADLSADSVFVLSRRSIVLGGLSDCAVDGEYAGEGPLPTAAGNVESLGRLLQLVSGKPLPGLPGTPEGMHLWQGDTWQPLRKLVLKCLLPDAEQRPTSSEVAEVLARYVAIARALQGGTPAATTAPTAGSRSVAATPRPPLTAAARGGSDGAVPGRPASGREQPGVVAPPARSPAPRIGRWALLRGIGLGRAAHHRSASLARRPLAYGRRITLAGVHPSCGRATTTLTLGAVLAALRGRPVLALDGAPARGDLHHRLGPEHRRRQRGADRSTLHEATTLPVGTSHDGIRRLAATTPSGLEVLTHSATHSVHSPAYGDEYRRLMALTAPHYPAVLTDWAGLRLDRTADVVLDLTDVLVVCCTTSEESVESAKRLLDRLRESRPALADNAIVVATRLGGIVRDTREAHIRGRFSGRPDRCLVVPFDAHLAGDWEIRLDRIKPRTAEVFVHLAGRVVGDPPD